MALGFFLCNRLDMVSVLVLERSVILGFFLGGHCGRKNVVRAWMVLRDSKDDGGVEYSIFVGKGRCESLEDAVMLVFSLSYIALLRVVQLSARRADKLELRIEFMGYSVV